MAVARPVAVAAIVVVVFFLLHIFCIYAWQAGVCKAAAIAAASGTAAAAACSNRVEILKRRRDSFATAAVARPSLVTGFPHDIRIPTC